MNDRHRFDASGLPQRIKSKIVMIGECWAWTAANDGKGYGMTQVGRNKSYRVHRLTYELLVGQIPSELILDHLCRNRFCCNPAHLEPVTHRENILRGDGLCADNARKTMCPKGHEYGIKSAGGWRECKVCKAAAGLEWQRRNGRYRERKLEWQRFNRRAIEFMRSLGLESR